MNSNANACLLIGILATAATLSAQEASSGIDVTATISGNAFYSSQLSKPPREGSSVAGGTRSFLYPTIKLGKHWSLTGTLEAISHPFDPQDFDHSENGIRGRVLQAALGYSKVWKNGSFAVRAGEMPTAFGSFMLRYDDAENPLIATPALYGYYYNPISTLGVAGVQADATLGKWDARLQFANSSPTNPRSVFDKDQYGNWVAGTGYTIRQGLRVGASAYRGPFLDRKYLFYTRGEARPADLPATGLGFDVDWATGHWNIRGEWQRFLMVYRAIPDLRTSGGYAEIKRTLNPRWYVAGRVGYMDTNGGFSESSYEAVVAYRPNQFQVVKAGWAASREQPTGCLERSFMVELVTTVHPLSRAWR